MIEFGIVLALLLLLAILAVFVRELCSVIEIRTFAVSIFLTLLFCLSGLGTYGVSWGLAFFGYYYGVGVSLDLEKFKRNIVRAATLSFVAGVGYFWLIPGSAWAYNTQELLVRLCGISLINALIVSFFWVLKKAENYLLPFPSKPCFYATHLVAADKSFQIEWKEENSLALVHVSQVEDCPLVGNEMRSQHNMSCIATEEGVNSDNSESEFQMIFVPMKRVFFSNFFAQHACRFPRSNPH